MLNKSFTSAFVACIGQDMYAVGVVVDAVGLGRRYLHANWRVKEGLSATAGEYPRILPTTKQTMPGSIRYRKNILWVQTIYRGMQAIYTVGVNYIPQGPCSGSCAPSSGSDVVALSGLALRSSANRG